MLDLPRFGNLNLHGSLLPKYRGAAPIQWAVANGEPVTGVTTMRLDEGLDTGDILMQREMAIAPDQTAADLYPAAGRDGRCADGRNAGGTGCGLDHPRQNKTIRSRRLRPS